MNLISKHIERRKTGKSAIEVTYTSCISDKCTKNTRDILTRCYCCGTVLKHPVTVERFKCSICHCTVETVEKPVDDLEHNDYSVTHEELQKIVESCLVRLKGLVRPISSAQRHEVFTPVEKYLTNGFGSVPVLDRSFVTKTQHELIDYIALADFYKTVLDLPTKRPLYKLMVACNELLKRPRANIRSAGHSKRGPFKLRWILIILEIPILKNSLTNSGTSPQSELITPQLRAILYEILKRCVGYLSSINSVTGKQLMHYLKWFDESHFCKQVDLLNLYITFHFSRILHTQIGLKKELNSPNFDEFHESEKLNPKRKESQFEIIPHLVSNILKGSGNSKFDLPPSFKFKIADYGNDWHIRTASRLMLFYFLANQSRNKCAVSRFYNTMLDFIDYKRDFEQWKTMRKLNVSEQKLQATSNFDDTSLVLSDFYTKKQSMSQFAMCQFSYLLSLGVKISIMEYETRRIMEYNAEQAFLSALDKKQMVDVYLRIRVRRDHLSQDSLHCIKCHKMDLKKSLKVEFVNEPGIDAGGLRKEWFSLLTRELFNPNNGLFTYVEESRFSWFTASAEILHGGRIHTLELYNLFGVILGLAIYNGTILDLSFPMAMYKKICEEPLTKEDFMELYPITGRNLMKMLEYEDDDFEEVFALTFEVNFSNIWGSKVYKKELCEGGSAREVTQKNKQEYVKLWMDFYMDVSIKQSFDSFLNGFKRVVESYSFKLFNSEELEQLLCGSQEKDIDVGLLKTVTKYSPTWSSNTQIILWFWELFMSFSYEQKKKLMQFVTGSDRVPATGIATIPFKITKLGVDSESLPLAHTCFNELCLYEYNSKSKLCNKLALAINESEGYGFR